MKVFYHVLGWFGFAVLLAAGYLGLLLALGGDDGTLSTDNVLSALGVATIVLCLALAGLGVSLIWVVVRAMLPRRIDPEETIRPRLVALAISALLFPRFFIALCSALASAGETLLADLVVPLDSDLQHDYILKSSGNTFSLSEGVWALCRLLHIVGAGLSHFLGAVLKPFTMPEAVRRVRRLDHRPPHLCPCPSGATDPK